MTTLIIMIIIQGIVVTTVKSMDMFLRTVLEHTSRLTTKGGWVKPHLLVVWRLVTSVGIIQPGQRHQVVNLIKAKTRKMLNTSEMRWKRHVKRKMFVTHHMEKGSLHLIGQVITPHQTRQSRGMRD